MGSLFRQSISPSVHQSVSPLVQWSVGPLVLQHESKSGKTSGLESFCVCVCVGKGLGGALGVDGGWIPLPTRPQRYCDPASLVPPCSNFVDPVSAINDVLWS